MNYEPAIDGLRAVAILAVLLFHVQPGWITGGFIGVDVFFVLSGYLITSVIVHDIRQGDFSIRRFYLHRVQRLLPNAVAMITLTVIACAALLPASFSVSVAEHGLWALVNLSNFYIVRNSGGYWGEDAGQMPLLHTWSLAVEEQFYLLFPPLLLLLIRFRILLPSLIFVTLISFAAAVWCQAESVTMAYYMLPTRTWQLSAGAVLAAYYVPVSSHIPLQMRLHATGSVGMLGLGLIIASCLFLTEASGVPGWAALPPVFGTLMVLMAINAKVGPSILTSQPFVAIGKLSYSLYLWHWPALVVGRILSETSEFPSWWPLVALELGVLLAIVAYYVIEQPLRQRDAGCARRFSYIGALSSLCVIACLWCSRLPTHKTAHLFDEVTFRGSGYTCQGIELKEQMQIQSSVRYADVRFAKPPASSVQAWKNGGIVKLWGGETPRVVVLGSSHALMYSWLIDDLCRQHKISVAFLCADSAPLFFEGGSNIDFDSARKHWLQKWRPDAVFAIDRWDRHATMPLSELSTRLQRFVSEVEPFTGTIVLFTQVPVLRTGQTLNVREFAAREFRQGDKVPRILQDENEDFREATVQSLMNLAMEHPKLVVIRPDRLFRSDDGSVKYTVGRAFYYIDDDHLSDAGAELVRGEVSSVISHLKDL